MNGWLTTDEAWWGEDARPSFTPGWRVRLGVWWADLKENWWAG